MIFTTANTIFTLFQSHRIIKKSKTLIKLYQQHYVEARDDSIRINNSLSDWFSLVKKLKDDPFVVLKYYVTLYEGYNSHGTLNISGIRMVMMTEQYFETLNIPETNVYRVTRKDFPPKSPTSTEINSSLNDLRP